MSYVVTKVDGLRLSAVGKDGRLMAVTLARGETVPDEEIGRWSYPNLVAHLNNRWIEWVGDTIAPHDAHKGAVVDIREYRNQKPGTATAVQKPGHTASAVKPTTIVDETECEKCGAHFKTVTALKVHKTKKHAGPKGAA